MAQAEHHSCGEEDDDPNSWCDTVTDPALWKNTSSDKVKSILIRRGAAPFQNKCSKYPASVRDRTIGGKARSFTQYSSALCQMAKLFLVNGYCTPRQMDVFTVTHANYFPLSIMPSLTDFVIGNIQRGLGNMREAQSTGLVCRCYIGAQRAQKQLTPI